MAFADLRFDHLVARLLIVIVWAVSGIVAGAHEITPV
jgi:hypothetical protein